MPRRRLPSIGRAIGLAFASTLLLMAVLVGLTLYEIQQTKYVRKRLTEELNPAIKAAQKVQLDITQLDNGLHIALLSRSPADPGALQAVQEANERLGSDVQYLETFHHPDQEAVEMKRLRERAAALQKGANWVLD